MYRTEFTRFIPQTYVTLVVLMMVFITTLLPGVALGQIDKTEPNLHGGEEVYGLQAATTPVPFVNSQDISLLALGETDSALYGDVSFYAYGLYADNDLISSRPIDVNAVGGLSSTASAAIADANAYAAGIYVPMADVNNTGTITVSVTGGTANAYTPATADANAVAIYSGAAVTNSGDLTATAMGGTATATGHAYDDIVYDATAHAYAYGILAVDDIHNTGAITATATSGSADANWADADAYAYGLYTQGDVNNAGALTATAHSTTIPTGTSSIRSAYAYGIDANGLVTNVADVNSTAVGGAATAIAIRSRADVDNQGDLTSTPTATLHSATSYGITSLGDVNNIGAITATSTAGTVTETENDQVYSETVGIHATGNVTNSGNLSLAANGGTAGAAADNAITWAVAFASVTGIDAYGDAANTGVANVAATGGTASAAPANEELAYAFAEAVGINTEQTGSYEGAINNTGDLTVIARGGTADSYHAGSIEVFSEMASATAGAIGIRSGGDANNAGTLAVTALGGTASANELADASASACGVYASGGAQNSGTIDVNALGGTASAPAGNARAGARAYGLRANGDVANTGNITATASAETGSTACAYGIYMDGAGLLTNTGILRASADEAYELYVAAGTTTLAETYNVTLDGDPNDASIFVADNATLAVNNATLTVTDITGETHWDTPYHLFETDPNGTVTGHFSDVAAVNPDATAVYDTQNTSSAADDTVSLTYSPEASETTESAMVEKALVSQSIDVVHRHMTNSLLQGLFSIGTSGLLVDAGPTARSMALADSDTASANSIFVEPYYSKMEHDAKPLGYDARLWGFAAGCERQMDNTLIALHVGYGQADVDYTGTDYSANSEDQDIVTAGIGGLTRLNDWTLRYGLTGFYGSHDYEGMTGLGLTDTEESETESYGLMASAMAGYIFQQGSHVLLPEIGLNWLWGHRKGYTSEASDPDWDTTYSAMNDHDLQAQASLNWLCGFMHKDIHVMPAASIGIRHLLTDGESTVQQSVPGTAPVSVKSERDRTAMTLSGSVMLTKTRHSLSLAYDGEYSPDTDCHSVWLRYGWQF